MKKHTLLSDKSNKEQSSSIQSKYGISHCERFQINKEGLEQHTDKINSNQNKKSASSSENSGNNNGKEKLYYKSLNSSEASNNEKELATTNNYSKQSKYSKESNNWNTDMKNDMSQNFIGNFEKIPANSVNNSSNNNNNDFTVPNQIDISNKIYERQEIKDNSRSNSNNSSLNNNSNNQISENDVDMEFIYNLTNQNNNDNNVIYNFNKNFNEDKKNEFENEIINLANKSIPINNNNLVNANNFNLNHVKSKLKTENNQMSKENELRASRTSNAEFIHKKPKTPNTSQIKNVSNLNLKNGNHNNNGDNLGFNQGINGNNSSSDSNNSSNNSNNNHNNNKTNSNTNFLNKFSNPLIQLDDNKINSLKFNLLNRNVAYSGPANPINNINKNKEIEKNLGNIGNMFGNTKEVNFLNVLNQLNNVMSGNNISNKIPNINNNTSNLGNFNQFSNNLGIISSLSNLLNISSLNTSDNNMNNLNLNNLNTLLNLMENKNGINNSNSYGKLKNITNSIDHRIENMAGAINNIRDSGNTNINTTHNHINQITNPNNQQTNSNAPINSQRNNLENDPYIKGLILNKVNEILVGNTLNDKISLLKLISQMNNPTENSTQSFLENLVLNNYINSLNMKAIESHFHQEVIKYTVENFCKFLKDNGFLIIKNSNLIKENDNYQNEDDLNIFSYGDEKNNSNTNLIVSPVNSNSSGGNIKLKNENFNLDFGSNSSSLTNLKKKRKKTVEKKKGKSLDKISKFKKDKKSLDQNNVIISESNLRFKVMCENNSNSNSISNSNSNPNNFNINDSQSNDADKFNLNKRNNELICSHKDKKHYAKNMCKSCYHRKGRVKKAWLCPHIYKTHYARGKCRNCYLNFYNREHNKRKNKKCEPPNKFSESSEIPQNVSKININQEGNIFMSESYGYNKAENNLGERSQADNIFPDEFITGQKIGNRQTRNSATSK